MSTAARLRLALFCAALLVPLAAPRGARAGGFEFSAAGTTAMGRGGAYAARADDAMALIYNPAMLADLPGTGDIMLNAGLGVWDACVQRTGTYGDAGGFTRAPTIFADASGSDAGWIGDNFGRVCNSGYPQFMPNVAGTVRLSSELRLGFGIMAPNGIGNGRFGSADGTSPTADGSLGPSPVRYMMTERNLLQFFPSVGIGWRATDWLRIGLTLQWGVAIVDFTNYTSTGISANREDAGDDIRTRLQVTDAFIPAGILSVHVVPHRNLDIMFSGRISDSVGGVVDASGTLDLTTAAYNNPSLGSPALAPETTRINNVTLNSGQPFQFTLAFRYADRIRPRAYERGPMDDAIPQVNDPLFGENFDIELDVQYLHLSQVQDFVVRTPAGSAASLGGTPVPVPSPLPIVHGWSDAIALRLGGDVNIVPGTFAIRAGAYWEQPLSYDFVRYMQNDFMQGFQIGLSLGATLRLERFDISLAYSHVFGETITAGANANYRYVSATSTMGMCAGSGATYDAAHPVASTGCYPSGFGSVVNGGTYTQEFNAVSLGLSYHFD